MPFSTLENIYTSLTLEKQKEAYDFICYLFYRQQKDEKMLSPLEKSLLEDREEIRQQIADGTLQTYSSMKEYRSANSL